MLASLPDMSSFIETRFTAKPIAATITIVDEYGRTIQWDPRLGRASQINVFMDEKRELAEGDRIQWHHQRTAAGTAAR